MKLFSRGSFWSLIVLFALTGLARADEYARTVELFKNAGESADFFQKNYAYAVFPTIGKAGLGIGGAGGTGRVYERGNYVGDVSMSQISLGFQAGGQAYSQIVFLQDKRAFDEFTSGEFAFGAGVGAIAITASASASAGTTAAASGGKRDATTTGNYYKGMAVFTIAKGGLMYEASLAGQKYSYKPRKK